MVFVLKNDSFKMESAVCTPYRAMVKAGDNSLSGPSIVDFKIAPTSHIPFTEKQLTIEGSGPKAIKLLFWEQCPYYFIKYFGVPVHTAKTI